ncbi:MAG: zinc ABC transporter substrate-binding protein [Pseudonocardia sp.]|nr:zinc ABC transporter substrate-binding protein [Pseudonocardia sp.]
MVFRSIVVSGTALALAMCMTACAAGSPSSSSGPSASGQQGDKVITVAASINAWGSILTQLGGAHVRATSIITDPATDPHTYEPTPADGRIIASSALFVENGIGYDSWAAKTIAASPDPNRVVLDVGQLVGVPEGGNPHRWYSPADVERVADAITADLKKIDPADTAYFDAQRQNFESVGLARYHQLINDIKTRYGGTPVGASESIFSPLAEALGLNLITPASFLKAISEGTDPSAGDKSLIDSQISGHRMKVYVYNSQNSTPDVAAQVAEAKQAGIPVTTVTETLSPATASFQDWQAAQLQDLQAALAQAAKP